MKNYRIIFFIVFAVLISDVLISRDKDDINIVLVYPTLTKKILYNSDSKFLPTDAWELFLMSNQLKYRIINDNNLDEIFDEDDIVIFPCLESVTEEMIEAIEEFLREGKGILITGNFAGYDAEGKIINEFQKRILNLHISTIPGINSISLNHTLKGNTPFSYNFKPGFKILLKSEPELYYGTKLSKESSRVGFYFPINNSSQDSLSGIISENKYTGRLLWLGFDLNQMIGDERNKFLLNSFDWLDSKPLAFINYLPDNYISAGIIYKNIDKQSDFNFSDESTLQLKINFLINPYMVQYLRDDQDVGDSNDFVIVWDDFFFSNMSPYEKKNWLIKTKSILKNIIEQHYFGISMYGVADDSSIINYLNVTGYSFEYLSGYSNAFAVDLDSTKNIYDFINTQIPGPNDNAGKNFIINNNGIFYLNADSLLSANKFKSYLTNPEIWFTTFSDLLNWKLKSEQIKVTTDYLNGEYEIMVRNTGPSEIENIGIWLSLPNTIKNLHIKNADDSAKLIFENDKKMFLLRINLVKGYQNFSYKIFGIND